MGNRQWTTSFAKIVTPTENLTTPALVILDLPPNFTGLQVLAAMRGCVDLRDMPVVVMTTRAIQWSQQKAHELNVSAYIVKPLALEDYLEVVASLSTLLAPDGSPSKPQTKPHWR
ncbi:hypothetical protein IB239_16750 [Pseudomonas sp. PDM12]|uniref:hypothetical protein n=1 Tax=Pseudomonas sp. PDM12 TaxID=2769260 RepID=UPI0017856AC8|nr:hypothetical protein [Pseudomonas sp. PDM12]MBD9656473.1 hypothetical protein [Pseudomonas sp. PDM12]